MVCVCVCLLGGLHQSPEEDTSVHRQRMMSTVKVRGGRKETVQIEEEGRWGQMGLVN